MAFGLLISRAIMHHAPAPSEVLSAFLHQGPDNLL